MTRSARAKLWARVGAAALITSAAFGFASRAEANSRQPFRPAAVVHVFATYGVRLVDSGLYTDADRRPGIRRSYIPYAERSGKPIAGVSVVVFFTTSAARAYLAAASHVSGAPTFARARNVVVSFQARARSGRTGAVRLALDRLSRRG